MSSGSTLQNSTLYTLGALQIRTVILPFLLRDASLVAKLLGQTQVLPGLATGLSASALRRLHAPGSSCPASQAARSFIDAPPQQATVREPLPPDRRARTGCVVDSDGGDAICHPFIAAHLVHRLRQERVGGRSTDTALNVARRHDPEWTCGTVPSASRFP